MLNPWSDKAPFNPQEPVMSALDDDDDDDEALSQTWAQLVLSSGMTPLIRQGSTAPAELKAFCEACVTVYSKVDFAVLPNQCTSVLATVASVWRALLAVLAKTFTPDHQA